MSTPEPICAICINEYDAGSGAMWAKYIDPAGNVICVACIPKVHNVLCASADFEAAQEYFHRTITQENLL